VEVIEPRYEELLSLVQAELRRSGFEALVAAGVVITGGSARMEGLQELAEEVFHVPVRIGRPQNVSGLPQIVSNPIYATGVGLLLFGMQHARERAVEGPVGTGLKGVWERMKSWFQGNF
jgi:cell division protein FtsA